MLDLPAPLGPRRTFSPSGLVARSRKARRPLKRLQPWTSTLTSSTWTGTTAARVVFRLSTLASTVDATVGSARLNHWDSVRGASKSVTLWSSFLTSLIDRRFHGCPGGQTANGSSVSSQYATSSRYSARGAVIFRRIGVPYGIRSTLMVSRSTRFMAGTKPVLPQGLESIPGNPQYPAKMFVLSHGVWICPRLQRSIPAGRRSSVRITRSEARRITSAESRESVTFPWSSPTAGPGNATRWGATTYRIKSRKAVIISALACSAGSPSCAWSWSFRSSGIP